MESNDRYICIYGASSDNIPAKYKKCAYDMSYSLAKAGWNTINGAGSAGIMRASSDGFLDAGAKAIGVIPQFMVDNGWHYNRLTDIITTEDMHHRKQIMAQRSACAIAMPGGCGTIEELSEIITWKQLSLYNKPLIIFNIDNFYQHFIEQLNHCIEEQFMKSSHHNLWFTASTVEEVIEYIYNYDEATPLNVESKI